LKTALVGASVLAATAAGLSAAAGPAPSKKTELASNPPANAQPSAMQLAGSVANNGDGIAAIVNDTPISNYDLQQGMALFIAMSGVRPTPDALKSIREQTLKQLETDRIEILEAQKNNISVSAGDVDKAISNLLVDNHMTMDQMKKILSESGVDMATLRSYFATRLAWSKTVQDQYGDRVHVSNQDVDEELARLKSGANKPSFHVAEIFQAVDSPDQDAKVLKDMTDLYNQVQQGTPFSAVARQFSQNPAAAQGGDLGFVQAGQLPTELDSALKTMHPGDVSQPIRSTGGYYILYYRERKEPAGTKVPEAPQPAGPSATLPLARVLLALPPNPPKDYVAKAMQAAGVIRSRIDTCEHLQQAASKMQGVQYFNLGTMKLSELSSEIQTALSKTQPGESTEPFGSSAGIEIIFRCDKALPRMIVDRVPTRDEVQEQLFEAQMEVVARRYLRDLRRDADIETR
jgi:peptidyl-prolyl cis-trans isomerase SurA